MSGDDHGQSSGTTDSLTRLGGAVAALLAILGGGAITGVLARLARDEHGFLLSAIALGGLAAAMWAMTAFLRDHPYKKLFLLCTTIVAGIGLALLVEAIVSSAGIRGRPSINANVVPGADPVLKASVSEAGLQTRSTLQVLAVAYTAHDFPNRTQGTRLYSAAIGPDADGNANVSFSVFFRGATYAVIEVSAEVDRTPNCSHRFQSGCVVISVATPT